MLLAEHPEGGFGEMAGDGHDGAKPRDLQFHLPLKKIGRPPSLS